MAALIALDWGTSSLRAFLMDREGKVLQTRQSKHGIQKLPASGAEGFERAFIEICGDWVEQYNIRVAVAAGMVGSAQGWAQAPYMSCPADTSRLADKAIKVNAPLGVRLLIAPGLSAKTDGGAPDVMRGEEIQISGALRAVCDGERLIVMPGTHSKWVSVEQGRIMTFASYMTGELFSVLRTHTILGRLMPDDADNAQEMCLDSFLQGVTVASTSQSGDLAHQIFSVRTLGLFNRIKPEALADYLSGIVIGHELISARTKFASQFSSGRPVLVIGEGALCSRYIDSMKSLGFNDPLSLGNTAPAGLYCFAVEAGLFV